MLYFTADAGDGAGEELWRWSGPWDGSAPQRVQDIRPGALGSSPVYLAAVYGVLYFRANKGDAVGAEMYEYRGSGSVTLVADIKSGSSSSNCGWFEGYKGMVMFAADGGLSAGGTELWGYDPTPSLGNAPFVAASIASGTTSSYPAHLRTFGEYLYFTANPSNGQMYELWRYDGIRASLVHEINSNSVASSYPGYMAVFQNKLFFSADSGNGEGRELWSYSGSGTPALVADIHSSAASSPTSLVVFDDVLYMQADGGDGYGAELWIYSGTGSPYRAFDIYAGASSSLPSALCVMNNTLFMIAIDATHGSEIFWLPSYP